MSDFQHPDVESLKQYAKDCNNSVDFDVLNDSVSLHLSACAACRKELQALQLINTIEYSDNECESSIQEMIIDHIDGRLSEKKSAFIKSEIERNSLAQKFALHYAASSSAMNREINKHKLNEVNHAFNLNKIMISKALSLFEFKIPAWMFLPTAAFATLMFSWLVIPLIMLDNDVQIIAYQDNNYLQFQSVDAVPGLGFFQSSKNNEIVFDQLKMTLLSDNQIKFDWPAIKNAKLYSLKIVYFEKSTRKILAEKTVSINTAILKLNDDEFKRRYEWYLTGETTSNQRFSAQGGFVIK